MIRWELDKETDQWIRKYFTRDLIGHKAWGFEIHHKDGDTLNCTRCDPNYLRTTSHLFLQGEPRTRET
jgi:hypothetical protein